MIVLDTHTWMWWVSAPSLLSPAARSAIEYTKKASVCPISCWEISTKVAAGKLELDRDLDLWVRQSLARPPIALLEITADIAVAAGRLGLQGFHGDPADRLIVATAIELGVELVTKDKNIREFAGVKTVW